MIYPISYYFHTKQRGPPYIDYKLFLWRKITKINSETLALSINNLFNKIQTNLEQFKLKRDEIEKIAGINLLTMSTEFKRVLGLLELQVKEYQLKRLTDEFVHERELLS